MLEWTVAVVGIFGNLALVVSVLVLLREVRENTRQTRAANAQSIVELAAPLYLGMVQDRQLAELYAHSAADYDSLDEIDRRRYRSLLTFWLIFYENIYYQRRHRFLDGRAFRPWWHEMRHFVLERNLARHWEELKGFFQEEFAQEVSAVIASLNSPGNSVLPDVPSFKAHKGPSTSAGEPMSQDRQGSPPVAS